MSFVIALTILLVVIGAAGVGCMWCETEIYSGECPAWADRAGKIGVAFLVVALFGGVLEPFGYAWLGYRGACLFGIGLMVVWVWNWCGGQHDRAGSDVLTLTGTTMAVIGFAASVAVA